MKTIETREDVRKLVDTFYAKVRRHERLGPIFNETVDDWESHLEKLTDFWESNLFNVSKFTGHPMRAHLQVDQKYDHTIDQVHFGNWLTLWFETIDEMYEGERAVVAKEKARNIAHFTFMRLYQARSGHSIH